MPTISIETYGVKRTSGSADIVRELEVESAAGLAVDWSAIWVGVFAALSVAAVLAIFAVGIGAEEVNANGRLLELRSIHTGALIFAVCSAFFSFVIGGWCAGEVSGITRSEPAILHGAIVWAVAVPLLAFFSAIGAGGYSNAWIGGLASQYHSAGTAPFERPTALVSTATEADRARYDSAMADYERNVTQWRADSPRAVRNAAILAATALLLGLMGSVIGGWMASGEPMKLGYRRESLRPAIG